MKTLAACFVLILMIAPQTHGGQLYRWVDEKGNIHVTDTPPEPAPGIRVQIHSYDVPDITGEPVPVPAPEPVEQTSPRQVVMYSASWCPVCKKAKAYFRQANIPYKDYDVETSVKGRRDFASLGGQGVPVILVGNRRLNGFSPASFERLYRER